jgi:hypothetical protein
VVWRFNDAQRRLARLLIPVNFTRRSPGYHDPALDVVPLPDLAPALTLARGAHDEQTLGIVRAHLTRGQNRLIWALEDATRLARSALEPSSFANR